MSVVTCASLVLIAAGMLIRWYTCGSRCGRSTKATRPSGGVSRRAWNAAHFTVDRVARLTSAMVLAAFILGAALASMILIDEPVATATLMWAQEPPQPPQLSDEERQALDDEKAGRPVKDPKVLSSAKAKQQTAEKYEGKRNQQKQRGAPRRR